MRTSLLIKAVHQDDRPRATNFLWRKVLGTVWVEMRECVPGLVSVILAHKGESHCRFMRESPEQ
jgi:hypothetical protein